LVRRQFRLFDGGRCSVGAAGGRGHRPSDRAPVERASAASLRRYLQRRAELGLDCSPTEPLIVDLGGQPFSEDRLQAHYEAIRTVRVALEANGSLCRALLSLQHRDAAGPSGYANAEFDPSE